MSLNAPAQRFEIGDAVLAAAILSAAEEKGGPVLIGLCGAQGSGKSTTVARLVERLGNAGRRTVVFSLDDFYLTLGERKALSETVHPLLATRGVPGTHDVALIHGTIDALLRVGDDDTIPIPFFDKAADDRAPADRWPVHRGGVDVILLEGWCIGARPQPEAMLATPVNALERDEDAEGIWRSHVNDQLEGPYRGLFDRLDLRLMLRAPDFECVHGWRAEQEAGLERGMPGARPPMDEAALTRFIAHYERITRWLIEDEPADLIADLARNRAPFQWRLGAGAAATTF